MEKADKNGPRWYLRRLQKIRHGSYIISVPPEWVKRHDVRPHETLNVVEANGYILVSLPQCPCPVQLNADTVDKETLKYLILVYYMQGADIIEIKSANVMSADLKREVKAVVGGLIGADIVDMTSFSITVGIDDGGYGSSRNGVVTYFGKMLQFLARLVADLRTAVVERNGDLLGEIIERSTDMDKRYRYAVRLISKMSQYPELNVLGNMRELIAYSALAKDMARAAYHVSRSAQIALGVDSDVGVPLALVSDMYQGIERLFSSGDMALIPAIRGQYRELREHVKSTDQLAYEVRRIGAYGIAIMDDIVNLYVAPEKCRKES